MKRAYKSPELKVFGTVTQLTLNACNAPAADGKPCNNMGGLQGRSTPGSGHAGFPK